VVVLVAKCCSSIFDFFQTSTLIVWLFPCVGSGVLPSVKSMICGESAMNQTDTS
jgi:hypothetical protein